MATWLWVVIAILVLIAVVMMFMFNKLVRLRAMTREGWSGIDVQLKRRFDLLPNLVETVKAYKFYEQDVLTRIVELRGAAARETGPAARGEVEGEIAQSVGRLFALAENYPDLKASSVFLDLQQKLTDVEDHLQYARRYYNGTVRNLNIYVQSFPSNLVAGLFGFANAEYFQLDSRDEARAPGVKLTS